MRTADKIVELAVDKIVNPKSILRLVIKIILKTVLMTNKIMHLIN
jgi:hypothetical protein